MNPDAFSTQSLLGLAKRLLLGAAALVLLVELVLWTAFRLPSETPIVVRLDNNLPGLKPKVTLEIDHNSMRSMNLTAGSKPAGSLRILCVGGNATQGQLQNVEDTWWGRLAVEISQTHGGTRVEIAANGEHSFLSLAGARWLESHAAEFKPDIIIANFGAGEVLTQPLEYTYSSTKYASLPTFRHERAAWKNGLLKVSQIVRRLQASSRRRQGQDLERQVGAEDYFKDGLAKMRAEFARLSPVPNPFRLSDVDPAREYLDALRHLAETAQAVGAQLVISGEPCLASYLISAEELGLCCTFTPKKLGDPSMVRLDAAWVDREIKRFQEGAKKFAEEKKLPFVDLNTTLPKSKENFVTETILTDAGAAAMAKTLAQVVAPLASKALGK